MFTTVLTSTGALASQLRSAIYCIYFFCVPCARRKMERLIFVVLSVEALCKSYTTEDQYLIPSALNSFCVLEVAETRHVLMLRYSPLIFLSHKHIRTHARIPPLSLTIQNQCNNDIVLIYLLLVCAFSLCFFMSCLFGCLASSFTWRLNLVKLPYVGSSFIIRKPTHNIDSINCIKNVPFVNSLVMFDKVLGQRKRKLFGNLACC